MITIKIQQTPSESVWTNLSQVALVWKTKENKRRKKNNQKVLVNLGVIKPKLQRTGRLSGATWRCVHVSVVKTALQIKAECLMKAFRDPRAFPGKTMGITCEYLTDPGQGKQVCFNELRLSGGPSGARGPIQRLRAPPLSFPKSAPH